MKHGFTLVELLVVIAIIGVLAGLTLGVGGPMRERAFRSRAAAEISALEVALERYKVDNGDYPSAKATASGNGYSTDTDSYDGSSVAITPADGDSPGRVTGASASQNGGRFLFACLLGRAHLTRAGQTVAYAQYFEPKSSQVRADDSGDYFRDPYDHAYGYYYDASNQTEVNGSAQKQKSLYNFVEPDIWSTGEPTSASSSSSDPMAKWITNWASQN